MARKSQFFIIASVVILLNLIIISQQVIRSTFPVSERALDELALGKDLGGSLGGISASSPYLVKRDLLLLGDYLESASAWKFTSSLCCEDSCDCPSVNLGNFTSAQGEKAAVRISSDKASVSASLVIKSAG